MMDLPTYRQAREDLTAFVEKTGGAEALSDEDFKTFVDRLGIEERLLADAEYSQAGRHYLAEQLGQYVAADPKHGIGEQGEKTWYDRVPYDLSTIRRLAGVAANALEEEAKSETGSAVKKEDVAATHAEKAALVDTHDVWMEVSIVIGYHAAQGTDLNPVFEYEGRPNLFGGLSTAYDFVVLVQKDFCACPVAPLQGRA